MKSSDTVAEIKTFENEIFFRLDFGPLTMKFPVDWTLDIFGTPAQRHLNSVSIGGSIAIRFNWLTAEHKCRFAGGPIVNQD